MQYQTVQPTQKLGEKGLIAFITFLSAFIPLTTDIYLPALPGMAHEFQTSVGMANLTLVAFFATFALATLVWGPLSDRLGRKKALQIGLGIYVLASVGCIFSGHIAHLIAFRILQAVGGGCANAVATAIVKDSFAAKKKRETVMAVSMSAAMIAPIVAPVIGAALLRFMTWQVLFAVLAFFGAIAWWIACLFTETLPAHHRNSGMLQALSRLVVVARNPRFALLVATFSLLAVPSIGFVSASAFIYINEFGLSEQAYSYFFALNALFIVVGPLLYLKIASCVNPRTMVTFAFSLAAVCGILICAIGTASPWHFALALIPATLMSSLVRPYATNLMLEQQSEDAGSASSLINSMFQILGCIGMAMLSLGWQSRVLAFGVLYAIVPLICLVLWTWYLKSRRASDGQACPVEG